MSTEIIVALIGLGGSALGSIIGIAVQANLIRYRLNRLEEKVNLHNGAVERIFALESHRDLTDERIKVINHRVADLERETGEISDNKYVKEH